MQAVLREAPEAGALRVVIGHENHDDALKPMSVVVAQYGATGAMTGTLAVLGPDADGVPQGHGRRAVPLDAAGRAAGRRPGLSPLRLSAMQERPSTSDGADDPVASRHQSSEQDAAESSQAQIDALTERAERLLANWQRAQADLSNYRSQVERERSDLAIAARASLAADLLAVLDDLERAMYVVSPELRALTWVDGIWLILRKLEAILKAHGLEEVDAQGQPFDPLVHQAIAQVEGEEGVVVSVVQKGYTLQKRLIRPAMVTVGGAPAARRGGDVQRPRRRRWRRGRSRGRRRRKIDPFSRRVRESSEEKVRNGAGHARTSQGGSPTLPSATPEEHGELAKAISEILRRPQE